MANAAENMALIQSIFIGAKEKGLSMSDFSELNKTLLKYEGDFISIAYEAAAMGVAMKSLEKTNSLSGWNDFYKKYGLKHAVQIHVGLGWAIAELNLDISLYIKDLESLLKYRVIDGFAYYQAKFRRRQAVRMQEIPENLDHFDKRAYNQGLGRCFWYLAQAEIDKLSKLISIFPADRHYDMWRGAGVAIAYVGGVDKPTLENIISASNNHLTALKCGIAIATQTKSKAGCNLIDNDNICEVVFNSDAKTITQNLNDLEIGNDYFEWLSNIESKL